MDKHQRMIELLGKVEKLKDQFNNESDSMLKGMRQKEVSKDGWGRYRDSQRFYSNARKELNSAHNDCLAGIKKPTISKIKKIEARLQVFDETWQLARHQSMIGILHR